MEAQKGKRHPDHPEHILRYLNRLYNENRREYSCRATNLAEFEEWQASARPVLRQLVGLDNIAALADSHRPSVECQDVEDMGHYTRQRCFIESEPDVRIFFWLLKPKGKGPFPLAVTPHGHNPHGYNMYVGEVVDEAERDRMVREDRDVAVQAVEEGFVAIAPATRGIAQGGVADISHRHGGSNCRSHLMHCLMAGRTAIGERVWDLEHLITWALTLPEVDGQHILMLGNSGGGMVTTYAAACDPRVTIAIPSCSFSSYVGPGGLIHHCDCNMIPGILEFGEFWDVAGLIAPRHLLVVNGRYDVPRHPPEVVNKATERVRAIFAVAGVPDHFSHQYGDAGHRFYKGIMWPFVRKVLAKGR